MRYCSFLFLVISLLNAPFTRSAPTTAEALTALGLTPASGFSVGETNSLAIDTEAFVGSSSLALTRTADSPTGAVSISISGLIEQNTLVEFYVKQRNIGRYFDFYAKMNSQNVETVWSEANAAGWQRASVMALTNESQELQLSFWLQSDEPNADAALLIDGFKIEPGNALVLEPHRGGTIVASPARPAYNKGESLTATAQANPGYRFRQFNIDSIDSSNGPDRASNDYPYELRERASINLLMRTHMRLSATYDTQIPCDGAEAWSAGPAFEVSGYDPERPEDFVQKAIVEGLHQPGVLAFELSAFKDGSIELSLPSTRSSEKLKIFASPTENTFVSVQIPFEAAPGSVEWFFNTGTEYQESWGLMKIRNLRYLTAPGTVVGTHGLGQVVREKMAPSETGVPRSRFNAEPAEGWVFIGWRRYKDGPFFSYENGLVLEESRPRSLYAIFGESFESESLSLLFVHDGKTTLSAVEASDGYTGVSLKYGDDNASSYLIARGISAYAQNLPAGAIEWVSHYDFTNVSRPQAEASDLYLITQNLESRGTEPFLYKFRHTIPDEPSYTLGVTGHPQSVTQSQGPFAPQQIATLSINEDYRDRFAGWQGDVVSSKPELQVTVSRDLHIAAYFQQAFPFESPIPLTWRSPYLFTYQNGRLITSLSPDFKTTLSGHAAGPCTLKFNVIGNPVVEYRTPTETGTVHLQHSGTDNSAEFGIWIQEAGDFSITFTGRAPSSSLDLQFLGVYQSVTAHRFVQGGSAILEDAYNSARIVGSTVTFSATPDDGYRFTGWLSPEVPKEASSTSVELYHDLTFIPEFTPDLGADSIAVAAETSENWAYRGANKSFDAQQPPARGEPVPFRLTSSAPGLLRFRVGPPTNAAVFIDGQPFPHRSGFSLEENTFLHEIPVTAGAHNIEILLSASTDIAHAHYGNSIAFWGLEFLPGYAILKGFNANPDYHFTLSPTAPGNVYPAGSKVTLTAPVVEHNTFDRWSGDVSGTSRSLQVTLDRHLSVAPIYRPIKSISPSSFSLSNGSNVFAIPHEWDQPLEVRGANSPSVFTFTIPANQELQFETEGTLESTMSWRVSGEPELQKYAGSIIAAPPSSQQRTATLSISIPVDSSEFVRFTNFQTRNRFFLAGDFGLNSEDVLVSPFKDDYAWGEQVTISLGDSFPSSSRFYDLVTFRTSYDTTEWPSSDFVREYKVSINGDTFVTGNIGASFTRTKGQLTTTPKTAVRNASVLAPDGKASRELDSNTLCRVHAGGSKYIRFYLNVPEGDFVIFDSFVSGVAIPIEGFGEWMQIGVPVPAGRDFISFSIQDSGLAGDVSFFSLIDTLSGYAPPLVSFGPGKIEIEPAQGVSSISTNVTLRAVPDEETNTHIWLTPVESSAPSIIAKPNSELPIFSYFETPEPSVSPAQLPWSLKATGTIPSFANSESDQRITLEDETITLTRTVTGPKVLELQSHIDQRVSLILKIGNTSYTVTHPNYNGSIAHHYPIPVGTHSLTLSYDPQTSDSDSVLYNLSVIDGYMLDVDDSETSVIRYPNKPYYTPGEAITLLANPPAGFTFASWTGTLQSQRNPLKILAISEHLWLKPETAEDPVSTATSEIWTPLSDTPDIFAYETLLEGPGALYLGVGVNSSPRLHIDGIASPAYPFEKERCYFLIPAGEHRVRLQQARSLRAAPSHYLSGYKIDFASERRGSSFQIIPEQRSYRAGDQVTVDWPIDLQPGPSHIPLVLQPSGQTLSLPYTFSVTDHLIAQLYPAVPSAMEGFSSSSVYPLLDGSQQVEFLDGYDIQQGVDLSFFQRALHLKLEARGTLSFTFRGNQDNEYITYRNTLKLDGKPILQLAHGQSYRINIPSGEHLLTWVALDENLWGTDTCYLDSLTFTPTPQANAFRDRLEAIVPPGALAISSRLSPEDDLDGDGIPNTREFDRGTNPGLYDLSFWIRKGTHTPAQSLQHFLNWNKVIAPANARPTQCIDLVPVSEYSSNTENDLYVISYLPEGIAFSDLTLQQGVADSQTGKIHWKHTSITPESDSRSATSSPTLIRIKLAKLPDPTSLLRLSLRR